MLTRMGEGFDDVVDMTEEFVNDNNQLLTSEASKAGFYQYGKESVENVVEGAEEKEPSLIDKFIELAGYVTGPFEEVADDSFSLGEGIAAGLKLGIDSGSTGVLGAAARLADNVAGSVRAELGIQSPSRVMMDVGKWTSLGLIKGMSDEVKQVRKASALLAESATPSIDLSYNTPNNINTGLTKVSGTIAVKTGDETVAAALDDLSERLLELEITMDGQTVGRVVEPHITEEQTRNRRIRQSFSY